RRASHFGVVETFKLPPYRGGHRRALAGGVSASHRDTGLGLCNAAKRLKHAMLTIGGRGSRRTNAYEEIAFQICEAIPAALLQRIAPFGLSFEHRCRNRHRSCS